MSVTQPFIKKGINDIFFGFDYLMTLFKKSNGQGRQQEIRYLNYHSVSPFKKEISKAHWNLTLQALTLLQGYTISQFSNLFFTLWALNFFLSWLPYSLILFGVKVQTEISCFRKKYFGISKTWRRETSQEVQKGKILLLFLGCRKNVKEHECFTSVLNRTQITIKTKLSHIIVHVFLHCVAFLSALTLVATNIQIA